MPKKKTPAGKDLKKQVAGLEAALADAQKKLKLDSDELEAYEGLLKLSMEDMRKIYDDLLRTHSQLMQADKLATIGTLTSGIMHEIKSPMMVIQGSFFLLETALADMKKALEDAGGIDEKTAKSLSLIQENLDRGSRCSEYLVGVIRGMRVFSRSSQNQLVAEDVNSILAGVISIIWNSIKNKIELKKNLAEKLPLIKCDTQQLSQVFMNLIVNASQAIDGAGTITVKSWAEKNKVCVSISDTGCGMTEEVRKRLFEPFFTTKGPEKGTGLGLSVSGDIVKKHEGTIEVESAPGKGTTFLISLPALPPRS